MLRTLKLTALSLLRNCRIFELIANTRWRQARLLILCYHGISLADEHCWSPGLYMSPDEFARRLEQLRAGGYHILRLEEAVERLRTGQLPPRAVVITFDDGLYDFYAQAWPLLERYGFPATVYLTTYYSQYNRPIFRLVCDYMMWEKRGSLIEPGLVDQTIDLRTPESRARELAKLDAFAKQKQLSARDKDCLAADLARRMGADWDSILEKRILHIMTPQEARTLHERGADIQLHTHRHLTPQNRELFFRELDDNVAAIQAAIGKQGRHFCYPSGVHYPQYPEWLREWGMETAVTCEAALTTPRQDIMLLPRLCDHSFLSPLEFEGWLCGLQDWIPQRQSHMADPD